MSDAFTVILGELETLFRFILNSNSFAGKIFEGYFG